MYRLLLPLLLVVKVGFNGDWDGGLVAMVGGRFGLLGLLLLLLVLVLIDGFGFVLFDEDKVDGL